MYRAFPESEYASALATTGPLAEQRELRPLSALERQVVALSKHDQLATLHARGRVARVLAFLLGSPPRPNRLANSRLETLRQYAVTVRHVAHPRAEDTQRLLAAGFTMLQAHWIRDHVRSHAH